jgi:hypothetical protein
MVRIAARAQPERGKRRAMASRWEREIDRVLADPAASRWLQDALREALHRDPVDAANDAEFLAQLLAARCDEMLREGIP